MDSALIHLMSSHRAAYSGAYLAWLHQLLDVYTENLSRSRVNNRREWIKAKMWERLHVRPYYE